MTQHGLAEVFPPGDFIREELEARSWTQADLAMVLGRPLRTVNLIINGKKAITAETARELGEAFDTGAEVWLNLESMYRLSTARDPAGAVRRRAHLYEVAPVKDMEQRHWIRPTSSVKELEAELKRFFEVSSLKKRPPMAVAARASGQTVEGLTPAQVAWCRRALQLATAIQAKRFSKAGVRRVIEGLRSFMAHPQEARNVPRALESEGIRLVVVEHLPGTKIDGAALWLNDRAPVVALSLRFDRIDHFWFTLIHELAHILHQHTQDFLDLDLLRARSVGAGQGEAMEEQANRTATQVLIPQRDLDSFIMRVKPYYSKDRIIQFAHRVGVHPGIVVGQLQYRREIGYYANREMLVGVRENLVSVALTDGWGHIVTGN